MGPDNVDAADASTNREDWRHSTQASSPIPEPDISMGLLFPQSVEDSYGTWSTN